MSTAMAAVLAWASALAATVAAAEPSPLAPVQTIPMPGVEGRIDHLDLDPAAQLLYVAALGNGSVEVLDLARGAAIHRIAGLGEPQGVAVIPDPHLLAVADGADGSVGFFDATTWRPVRRVVLPGDADNLRYDAAGRTLYVGFGHGGIAGIDPSTGTVTATMPLPGHPEAFALEGGGTRILANVPGSSLVAVLDRSTRAMATTWDLGASQLRANFPMALDEARHRLFIGCRAPARLLVLDTVAGVAVAQIDIAGDVDDLFYDPAARRIVAICGDGCIDILDQADADHYRRRERIATAPGARTGWWAGASRRLYVAVPHRGGQAAGIQVYQAAP